MRRPWPNGGCCAKTTTKTIKKFICFYSPCSIIIFCWSEYFSKDPSLKYQQAILFCDCHSPCFTTVCYNRSYNRFIYLQFTGSIEIFVFQKFLFANRLLFPACILNLISSFIKFLLFICDPKYTNCGDNAIVHEFRRCSFWVGARGTVTSVVFFFLQTKTRLLSGFSKCYLSKVLSVCQAPFILRCWQHSKTKDKNEITVCILALQEQIYQQDLSRVT